MGYSTPGFPVHHQLLELTQTHVHRIGVAIQPSHPLSSPSPLLNIEQNSLCYTLGPCWGSILFISSVYSPNSLSYCFIFSIKCVKSSTLVSGTVSYHSLSLIVQEPESSQSHCSDLSFNSPACVPPQCHTLLLFMASSASDTELSSYVRLAKSSFKFFR